MISLRKITLENRRLIFNLEVAEDQNRFVASNLSSVASCYVLLTNGGTPFPLAIYADEQPVGFVMITYGITGYEIPSIAHDSYCILRLMIDREHQGKGYGSTTAASRNLRQISSTADYSHNRSSSSAYSCSVI